MADRNEIRYEIQVSDGGRWTIFTDSPSKLRAIEEAKSILGSGKFDGVKVTEDRGQKSEILVFEEAATARIVKDITVTPVDVAPLCANLEDLYSYAARATLGAVLRKYFDQLGLTPTELLHDPNALKTLLHQEELVLQAVQNVAGVQARQGKVKPAKRIDDLQKLIRLATKRASALGDLTPYVKLLRAKGLSGLINKVEQDFKPEDQYFRIRGVLTQRLKKSPEWEDKLDALIGMTEHEPDAQSLIFIDELIAEIFESNDAVQEILGYQRNLASAMRTLIQLSAGSYEISEDSDSVLERISKIMQRYHMPRNKAAIVDRVARNLRGISPLTKGDRAEEREALTVLVGDIVGNHVLSENGALAEAVSLRVKSVFRDEFEDEDAERAISDVLSLLPNKAVRFGYLLELSGTSFGQENQDYIVESMAYLVEGMTSAVDLVEPGADKIQILQATAGIRDRLLATALPDRWRLRFARDIYELLIAYSEGTTRAKGSGAKKSGAVAKAQVAKAKAAKPTPAKDEGPLDKITFPAGKYIFREGDEGDVAYLILDGTVDIIRQAGDHEVVIAHAGRGSIVGEMALIDSEPRMASAKTTSETEVTMIPMAEMQTRLTRLAKFDPVLHRLVGMFVQRMRDYKVIDIES